MFKPKKLTFTILCLVIALAFATVSQANDLSAAQRRDHVEVGRMIKKRAPQAGGIFGPIIGAGANPPPPASSSSAAASAGSSSSSPTSSATSAQSSASSSAASTSAPSSSSSAASSASSSSSSGSSSSASSSSSSSGSSSRSSSQSSSSSSASSTSAPSAPTNSSPPSTPNTSAPPDDTQPSSTTPHYTSLTVTQQAAQTSAANDSGAVATGSITRTTIIVLAAVGASIGGLAIVWTVIRKWKLKPSSRFDDRMQPIDWQPTVDDSGLPDHRRASVLSHGSFHSGNGHGSDSGHGHGNPALETIPDHDFTAVPQAALAPVGGYADLQRGPSPQPQMAEALSRGPSVARPGYEQYGVPLHHQGGYQGGYDAYDYSGAANPRY